MINVTFSAPDVTTFCGLDTLGLEVTGQQVASSLVTLECQIVEPDNWCHRCGCEGIHYDTVSRALAHAPIGWTSVKLLVRVRRYRCVGCGHVWRQESTLAATPRAKISRAGLQWGLAGLVMEHLSVSRVAAGLGVSWRTANTAILEEGRQVLINDPNRFDGVRVIGVDEHCWRHTNTGDKYVTVIIDLTPVRNKTGPARLLDMVDGRSKQVFSRWLQQQTQEWRDGIEVVAMDGFTGFKTASKENLPGAVEVMDPFHVVQLAGDALDRCRQRVQQETMGHRGRTGDPLYAIRRVLRTGEDLLTEKQRTRLDAVFADPAHADVHRIWKAYQQVVAAYREPLQGAGRIQIGRASCRERVSSPV